MFRSSERKIWFSLTPRFATHRESHHDFWAADHGDGGLRIKWRSRNQVSNNANIATPRLWRGLLHALRAFSPSAQPVIVEQIVRCARATDSTTCPVLPAA
jgi:hypothetical protein